MSPEPTTGYLVVKQNRRQWLKLNRERLGFLVKREIKSRYKDTWLGLLWIIITPIIQALVISFFLVKILGLSAPGVEAHTMPLVVLSGLVLWNFVSRAFSQSMSAFSGRRELVITQPLPLAIFPVTDSLTKLFDFVIDTLVVVIMAVVVTQSFSWNLLWLPVLGGILWLFVVGLCLLASLIEVRVRDVGHLVSFFLSIWFWSTPIFYPAELVPSQYQFMNLNPLLHFLASYRQIILSATLDVEKLSKLFILSTVWLVVAVFIFNKNRRHIYDVV